MTDPRWSCIASPSRMNRPRSQDEQARHQDEQASPPAVKTRTCVHNDYEDLL